MNLSHRARLAVTAGALALAITVVPAADYEQGLNYFRAGKYVEAAAEFQAIVDESPTYDFGHYMLGLSMMQMGKGAAAEKALLKAVELNGDRFEYHHALAKSYYDRGEFSKAVATLNNAEPLAADAQQKKALYEMRGYALAAREQWSDAIEDLEKARAQAPTPRTLTQLGKAYFALRHSDKAVENFRASLAKDARQPETQRLLAEALLNMGANASGSTKERLYDEALAEAKKVAQLEPSSADARYLVGRAALGAGEYTQAVQAFEQVLAKKSNHCNAMVNMGKAYTALQQWQAAAQAMTNATRCDSKMAVAWEGKGFALQKQKSYEQAIEAYQQALAIKPTEQIRGYIKVCEQNLSILAHNRQMDAEEQQQQQALLEEQKRLEEERRKREEWEKRQEGGGG